MKAATLSVCTVHALKEICHKRGSHADASDSRETLIDTVRTNLVADAKLEESRLPSREIVLLQDNFSASLECPEDQDVKASIAAALQSDAGNRGNTSKCGQVPQRGAHSSCVGTPQSLSCRPLSMLHALHSGEAERRPQALPQGRLGQRAFHLGEAFCRRQGQQSLCPLAEWRKPETALCGRVACRALRPVRTSPTVGMLIPLSGNWVPAWSIRVLKPTDEESQDAPPPSVICQTVKVALKGFGDFNIELIALVRNPEFIHLRN